MTCTPNGSIGAGEAAKLPLQERGRAQPSGPQGGAQGVGNFVAERQVLTQFMDAARAADARYEELLPVLVARGGRDVNVFRAFFVGESRTREDCDEDVPPSHSACGSASRAAWDVTVFNTRTRRQYRSLDRPGRGGGWRPDIEHGVSGVVALRLLVDAVFDGHVMPYFRSLVEHHMATPAIAAPGIAELTGMAFGRKVVDPVAPGVAEVLILLYVPWCAHSLAFLPLWHALAAGLAATAPMPGGSRAPAWRQPANAVAAPNSDLRDLHGRKAGRLALVQMDAMQNEHPDLPAVVRFPTLLLCLPPAAAGLATGNSSCEGAEVDQKVESGAASFAACGRGATPPPRKASWAPGPRAGLASSSGGGGPGMHCVEYDGGASLPALHAWLAEHSSFAPSLRPLADRDGFI